MNRQDTLAEGIRATKANIGRYLAGFDDTTHTRQAPNLPNHVAWCLGHLALTMHRANQLINPSHQLPDSDFHPTTGDTHRFGAESVAFGSTPVSEPAQYPTLNRAIEIYDRACDALAESIRKVPDDSLDELVPWGGSLQISRALLAMRMIAHSGIHTGQIADLRRALRFKSVFV